MTRILGIDPGSRVTGYGIINCRDGRIQCVDSGVIRPSTENLSTRLHQIFTGVSDLIEQHKPDVAAIEKVFVSVNAKSALMLGQARGSIICACGAFGLMVHEYAARRVKNSVTGSGSASKEQVQYMTKVLLNIDRKVLADEADALAVAITHFQFMPAETARLVRTRKQAPATTHPRMN